jgi:hypothetical protein
LGRIPVTRDYCIDFGTSDFDPAEYRKKLIDLMYNRDYFEACRYCSGAGDYNIIPVAEQL